MIEGNVLSAEHANYLAAFVLRDGTAGVAMVEASTITGFGLTRAPLSTPPGA